MAKSTLKNWLKGRNTGATLIEGSKMLVDACCEGETDDETTVFIDGELWNIDVLDDGTAISYKNS